MTETTTRLGLLGTGGTISLVGSDPYDVLEYADHGRVLEVHELAERLPAVPDGVRMVPVPFRAIRSNEMSPPIWLELRQEILAQLSESPAVDGLVITHGTATLEETAYFLHLTLATDAPIALVGAQRPSTAYSSDAPMNYLAAVRAAAAAQSRGQGVMVVMNDQILSPREVTKGSNHRLEAFRSREFGALGHVDADGSVVFYRASTRRHTVRSHFADSAYLDGATALPRVDIIASYSGCDGWAVDAAVAAGARGIVLASLAPGLHPPRQDEAVDRALDAGVVVVMSSRAGEGRVLRRRSYGDRGLVSADNLSPQAARVLLSLALHSTDEPGAVQNLFDSH